MEAWFIGAAGFLGLLVGMFLTKVIRRVPHANTRGHGHSHTHTRISTHRRLIALCTAAAFALVTWWGVSAFGWPMGQAPAIVAWWLTLAGFLWFAAATIALTVIDIDHHRLPNAIVLPSLGVVTATLTSAAILASDWDRLVSTLGGAAALFALYFVIALVSPRGMGGGDVKLAPLIGIALGYLGWEEVAVGTLLGFVLGALWSVVLLVSGRASRKRRIPFGPFMLLGTWVALDLGGHIWNAYLLVVGVV